MSDSNRPLSGTGGTRADRADRVPFPKRRLAAALVGALPLLGAAPAYGLGLGQAEVRSALG